MTTDRPSRSAQFRRTRRSVALATLIATGVTTLALPMAATVQAAPHAPTMATSVEGRARQADTAAAQAVLALGALSRHHAGDLGQLAIFEQLRDEIAGEVAQRLGLDADLMREAWDRADLEHQTALMAALSQLGVAYRRNTSNAGVSFDCSGLTTWAWAQAGHTLTRQSSAQIRKAAPRDQTTAQAGDLVQYPGHVMIWLGVDRAVVHAIQPGKPVGVDLISSRKKLRFGDPTSD